MRRNLELELGKRRRRRKRRKKAYNS